MDILLKSCIGRGFFLEKEVTDLRFESISAAADLMLMRKQSEIIKRIKNEGLALEESKEPPVKLYR